MAGVLPFAGADGADGVDAGGDVDGVGGWREGVVEALDAVGGGGVGEEDGCLATVLDGGVGEEGPALVDGAGGGEGEGGVVGGGGGGGGG